MKGQLLAWISCKDKNECSLEPMRRKKQTWIKKYHYSVISVQFNNVIIHYTF